MNKGAARMRVMLFTTHLGGGGAEMQMLRLANHLDRNRFDPHVVVNRGCGSYEGRLSSDVAVTVLKGRTILAKTNSLRNLAKEKRPDIICSFLELPNLMAGWATSRLKPRPHLVSCVQAPPSIVWKGGVRKALVRTLAARYYGRAEQIIAISKGVASDIVQLSHPAEANMEVIYNAGTDDRLYTDIEEPLDPADSRPRDPLLIGCGRLMEQKGFPDLINAFCLVREKIRDAKLWIVGEGPDRLALEEQIRRLSLGDSARLLGYRNNPYRYMAAADVFVLSSIYEGFGNVIVEAMACGTPVVATDCPHGPSEIITDGVDGLLVPTRDAKALADAILRVLGDNVLRTRITKNGKDRAKDFDADVIAHHYGQVFERLYAQSV